MALIALILVFASGFAALVYQVLWMRQLGLLFGNTSHAAAVTLAAFFAGLAAGSWLWGERSRKMRRPLRAYAWLEIGIAVTATLYFVILQLHHAVYPMLFDRVDGGTLLAVRFALAMLLVFPPALFMGGTIPVMGQYLIRPDGDGDASDLRQFGTTSATLYAVNTTGAALGAFLAGFYLPLWLGFRLTCITAIAVTAATAALAFAVSRTEPKREPAQADAPNESPASSDTGDRLPVAGVCFLSGFGFLALEVLWSRMFMQVLENSVYTFATMLVIVLICLAVGAWISSRLARLPVATAAPMPWLAALVLLGGLAVAVAPSLFMSVTNGMEIIATRESWAAYIGLVFLKASIVIGPPALTLGAIFPFIMKTEERHVRDAGASLGRLAAINTAGAILGSLLCGFVLLGSLGMWRTMQVLAMVYVVAAMALPIGFGQAATAVRAGGAFVLLLLLTLLNPVGLPLISTDPARILPPGTREETLEVWEASDSTVALTRGPYGLMIKMNSHYGLGTTGSAAQEQLQAELPLKAYPGVSSVFFLGMGTGITAGAALDREQFPDVQRIVVCELSPQVVHAAEKYIANADGFDYTGGLFTDPRAAVLVEDGRHYLMATRERFDMINADLFVPFRSGVGSLYTVEHFESAKARLAPGGVFVQWLPLYQVTEYEFSVVARTMLEVFDTVTLWRGGFQPGDDTIAIVGQLGDAPLPATDVDRRDELRDAIATKSVYDLAHLSLPFNEQTVLLFYCGNLGEAASLLDAYPVNSDDYPVIEYRAPRNYRKPPADDLPIPWFIGPRIAAFVEKLQAACPPTNDPFLAKRNEADRSLPLAGAAYYDARYWQLAGDPARCEAAWRRFTDEAISEPITP